MVLSTQAVNDQLDKEYEKKADQNKIVKDFEAMKADRTKQWGSDTGVTQRGWDRYRSTTFLEVVSAKIDRVLQCQQKIDEATSDTDVEKLKHDCYDSLLDAQNYLDKCMEVVSKDLNYLYYPRIR